jgi:protein-S-isoprenylcysteine O-methyltransferase Ste14
MPLVKQRLASTRLADGTEIAYAIAGQLFALAASAYIAVGVHFEERDLRRNLGTAYRDYARDVPRFVPGAARPVARSRR